MFDFCEDSKKYYIIMEFCTGKELFDAIVDSPGGAFNENVAANYVLQMLKSVQYCHHKGIVHRDLK